jgi:CIC family chloride channel protein
VIAVLVGLLAAKVLATCLTMWIGGSGGVFAPSLFMGAMLGSAYGTVAHHLMPHLAAAAGAYGLVGMGAVFAAAARAPITAVLIVFELTGDYNVILPLMFAIVVATTLSNRLTRDTICAQASSSWHRRSRAAVAEADGADHRRRRDGKAAPTSDT